MAQLQSMPTLSIKIADLAAFGQAWMNNNGRLRRTPPYSSGELGKLFDAAVANSLSVMLGDIPVVIPNPNRSFLKWPIA